MLAMSHRTMPEPEVSVALLLDTTVLEEAKNLVTQNSGNKIYLLDVLRYILRPQEFHSVIIPNAAQLIEFGRSYVHPETNQEVVLNHRGNLPGIQKVRERLSSYPQSSGADALSNRLKAPLPEKEEKWIVHHSQYSETRNAQMYERHEYAKHVGDSPAKLTQRLVRSKHIKGGVGEKDIRSIIEKTDFHRPVYIISDDLRAFYDKEKSPHYVEHLRTKDNQKVHFSTLENLVSGFLSVPANRKRLERDLDISPETLLAACVRDINRPHQHEVVSGKKWVYPVEESMANIFGAIHNREIGHQEAQMHSLIPGSFTSAYLRENIRNNRSAQR
jgi:hypothetical protein